MPHDPIQHFPTVSDSYMCRCSSCPTLQLLLTQDSSPTGRHLAVKGEARQEVIGGEKGSEEIEDKREIKGKE